MDSRKNKKLMIIIAIVVAIVAIVGVVVFTSGNNNNSEEVSTIGKHKGTITYNGESKEVEVIDHKINYFNLTELFSSFNSSASHNLKCNGTLGTIRETENAYSKGNNTSNLKGNILYIYSSGKNEITEYEIKDNFSIDITDFISASSINWNDYMRILPDSTTTSVAGISMLTLKVEVDNISEEDLIGKITNVYVNNSPIASSYILDSTYDVWKKDKSVVQYPASSQALASAGENDVNKIGMEVQLTDKQGNQIYKNVVWINL